MNDRAQDPMPEPRVHLVVDHSNLWHSMRNVAAERGEEVSTLRFHISNLHALLAAGRPVASATIALPLNVPEAVQRRFASLFHVVQVDVGQSTGTEQAGDEILQNRFMMRAAAAGTTDPGTLVLATGDGAGWRRRVGFLPLLLWARRLGLGVELVAFQGTLNGQLRAIGEVVGSVAYPRRPLRADHLPGRRPPGRPAQATAAA